MPRITSGLGDEDAAASDPSHPSLLLTRRSILHRILFHVTPAAISLLTVVRLALAHLPLLCLRVAGVLVMNALDGFDEAVPQRLALDLGIAEEGHLGSCFDIRHFLDMSLGEDDVDLLQRAVGRLWVEDPDDREKTGIDQGKEEVGAPADVGDHDGCDPGAVLVWTFQNKKGMDRGGGTHMTIRKLNSQLLHVDTAFALARVLIGLTSAGYSHGRGSQVAPKLAI